MCYSEHARVGGLQFYLVSDCDLLTNQADYVSHIYTLFKDACDTMHRIQSSRKDVKRNGRGLN